ncbi:MAG: FkbM family methyltransferase [Verrucomicrobiota bacterium]
MATPDLLGRFQSCLRYKRARSWQKPLIDPRRFFANQLRKHGIPKRTAGALEVTPTFHFPEFTSVQCELVSEEIASYSLFEPDLTEAFLRLVETGETVIDIGMHLGYYSTLFAVLVGHGGQVHAFEPTPSTRQFARHNTSRFPQITVHPLAVWSSSRTLQLRDYGVEFMGFNSLFSAKLDEEPARPKEIEVQTITLDQFRASLPQEQRVSVLKIDAESAERDIIAGGRQLIQRDQPVISVEVGDRESVKESRLLNEDLVALGYAPWEFRSGRFQRHQMRQTYTYGNLIFAPASVSLDRAAGA